MDPAPSGDLLSVSSRRDDHRREPARGEPAAIDRAGTSQPARRSCHLERQLRLAPVSLGVIESKTCRIACLCVGLSITTREPPFVVQDNLLGSEQTDTAEAPSFVMNLRAPDSSQTVSSLRLKATTASKRGCRIATTNRVIPPIVAQWTRLSLIASVAHPLCGHAVPGRERNTMRYLNAAVHAQPRQLRRARFRPRLWTR